MWGWEIFSWEFSGYVSIPDLTTIQKWHPAHGYPWIFLYKSQWQALFKPQRPTARQNQGCRVRSCKLTSKKLIDLKCVCVFWFCRSHLVQDVFSWFSRPLASLLPSSLLDFSFFISFFPPSFLPPAFLSSLSPGFFLPVVVGSPFLLLLCSGPFLPVQETSHVRLQKTMLTPIPPWVPL